MNIRINTRKEEMCLALKIGVLTPATVRIKIFDDSKPNIIFTDRYKTIKSTETFFIRLPMTSEKIVLSIYDDKKGNSSKESENNIKVLDLKKQPLEKRLDVVDIHNRTVAYFVEFAQRFCYNASYLKAPETYQSDNGEFLIEYVPTIIDKNGKEMSTPARISRLTGRIQVSKNQFDKYTVPMRFAILCHEFSHFYVNDDMNDESEADLNGLLIYLGLGYPRIEAFEAFAKVFLGTPTVQNKERYDKINNFIKNFENNKIVFK